MRRKCFSSSSYINGGSGFSYDKGLERYINFENIVSYNL